VERDGEGREGGLRVVEVRRSNWGTTWWVELERVGEGKGAREEKKVEGKKGWWYAVV
jgi:hypothetical protein